MAKIFDPLERLRPAVGELLSLAKDIHRELRLANDLKVLELATEEAKELVARSRKT